MAEFRFGEPSRLIKGKVDKSVIKPLSGNQALGFQSHGFKAALLTLKTGPAKFIEKSFKKQSKFIKERIIANAPPNLDSKKFEDSLEIKVDKSSSKISMTVSVKGSNLIRAHEDPSVISSEILAGHTEEGGKGAKFLTRVFDTHSKKIQSDTLREFAAGFGDNLKKSKKAG